MLILFIYFVIYSHHFIFANITCTHFTFKQLHLSQTFPTFSLLFLVLILLENIINTRAHFTCKYFIYPNPFSTSIFIFLIQDSAEYSVESDHSSLLWEFKMCSQTTTETHPNTKKSVKKHQEMGFLHEDTGFKNNVIKA